MFLVALAIWGPANALIKLPATDSAIARGFSAGGTTSAAANRRYSANPIPIPVKLTATNWSKKLRELIASAPSSPPQKNRTAPTTKPTRRPYFAISCVAGTDASTLPTCEQAIGIVETPWLPVRSL